MCACCSTASIIAASLSLARKRVSCVKYVLMLCWCRLHAGHWSGRSMPDLERTGFAAASAPPAACRRRMPSMCERQSCTSMLNTWPARGGRRLGGGASWPRAGALLSLWAGARAPPVRRAATLGSWAGWAAEAGWAAIRARAGAPPVRSEASRAYRGAAGTAARGCV